MFKCRPKIIGVQIVAIIEMLFGGIMGSILTLGSVVNFSDSNSHHGFLTYIVIPLPFLLIFADGIRRQILLSYVNKFNTAFECDPDGVIFAKQIALAVGTSEDKAIKKLNSLIGKGFLKNVTLNFEKNEVIITLTKPDKNTNERFETVICSSCGGSNYVKIGFVSKCKYCGSDIRTSLHKI